MHVLFKLYSAVLSKRKTKISGSNVESWAQLCCLLLEDVTTAIVAVRAILFTLSAYYELLVRVSLFYAHDVILRVHAHNIVKH